MMATSEPPAVYVLGVGMHPATLRETSLRLEEMVFATSTRALAHAAISRRQLDHVVLGASDELDGRPISSMLMTGPAGGYLTDEIKVTDSGATALCMGFARIRSGEFDCGLVASWCKSSKTSPSAVMRYRADPFYLRPLGFDASMADGLFAQAMAQEHGITAAEAGERAHRAAIRAQANPRGLQAAPVDREAIAASELEATPIRAGHIAPVSDGAVSIVLGSAAFLRANPQCTPIARITGVGWCSDSYQLGAERLSSLRAARRAWRDALAMAGIAGAHEFDAIELESPTSWHEAAWIRAFDIADEAALSPSGGTFAQNPFFCAGLINAAEAILQVAGQAGPVQVEGARRAVAHGCHGFAQQGSVVMVIEHAGDAP